jgi:hypothetical protein
MMNDVMRGYYLALLAALPCALAGQSPEPSLDILPAVATTRLARSLEAAAGHRTHVWRDTPPLNDDGSINALIEISRLEGARLGSVAEGLRHVTTTHAFFLRCRSRAGQPCEVSH